MSISGNISLILKEVLSLPDGKICGFCMHYREYPYLVCFCSQDGESVEFDGYCDMFQLATAQALAATQRATVQQL